MSQRPGARERVAARRKRRRQRGVLAVLLTAVVLAVVVFLVKLPSGRQETGLAKRAAHQPRKEKPGQTLVVVGVDTASREATGIVLLALDKDKARISAVVIDAKTFIDVPDRGFEAISGVYMYGMETLVGSLEQFLGIKADGFVVTDYTRLRESLNTKRMARLLDEITQSTLGERELAGLRAKVNSVSANRVRLFPLPVREVTFGEQVYFEARPDDVSRLTKGIWGGGPARSRESTRVIILNGNGVPGVARKAANRLIGKPFRIIDLKNADNFDYEKSQIVVYDESHTARAREVAGLLGTGEVVSKVLVQDVTDLVVIVGRDFNPE